MVPDNCKCLNLYNYPDTAGGSLSTWLNAGIFPAPALDYNKQPLCPRWFPTYHVQYDKPVFSGKLPAQAGGGEGFSKSIFRRGSDGEYDLQADRIRALLARLDDIPWEKRTACFKCVIALATAEGRLELCRGECQGMIAFKARGESGFGYDPIFYLPEIGKAMSELPLEVKNEISHRAQASQKVHEALKRLCS